MVAGLVVGGTVVVVTGTVVGILGIRKKDKEIEVGYTTYHELARERPDLFYLHLIRYDVLAVPSIPWKSLQAQPPDEIDKLRRRYGLDP